jgi:sugar O-acyltransferase (sialic acid O-acetyltransferase NeuD family)
MTCPLYVIGAGGHGKVVISTLQECGFFVDGVLDDDRTKIGDNVLGVPVIGTIDSFIARNERAKAIFAVGNNHTRKMLSERLSSVPVEWISAVHPRAWVHPSVRIREGTVVFAGAVIQPESVLGSHCIVNTGALIDHDCLIGDFCHIAPGCRITGGVTVGEGTFLGAGSTVIPGKTIGAWSITGAGSTIIRDLPPEITAVGTPARILSR